MPNVRVRDGESVESAIRRLKRMVEKSGTPKELRRREFHVKRSAERKREQAAARKRHLKKLAREQLQMGSARGTKVGVARVAAKPASKFSRDSR